MLERCGDDEDRCSVVSFSQQTRRNRLRLTPAEVILALMVSILSDRLRRSVSGISRVVRTIDAQKHKAKRAMCHENFVASAYDLALDHSPHKLSRI
jgi:hypothetical protein